MQVIYKGEILELTESLDQNVKNQDIFKENYNLDDTLDLNPNDFNNKNDLSKIELEETIELGGDINE